MTCLESYESAQSNYTSDVFWGVANALWALFLAPFGSDDFWNVIVALWCGTCAAGYFGAAVYYRSECRRLEGDFKRFGAFWCLVPDIDD